MNNIDAFILIVAAFNLILGAMRGAVWQVLRVASLGLGYFVASTYGRSCQSSLPASFGMEDAYGLIIVQIVLFLSVYLVMFGFTHLIKSFVTKVKLGSIDRILGGLLGAAKGVAFCCLGLYLQFTPLGDLEVVSDQLVGNAAKDIAPSEANKIFLKYMKDEINQRLPNSISDRVKGVTEKIEKVVKKTPK